MGIVGKDIALDNARLLTTVLHGLKVDQGLGDLNEHVRAVLSED